MTALVAPADVRSFLSLNATQDESLLATLCDAASAFVLGYCNRSSFDIQQRTERYNGTGGRILVPNCRPITAVASLAINGTAIPLSTSYAANGYVFDEQSVLLRGHYFERGMLNVDITYSAGYTELPAEVKQAIVETVAEKYQRRTRLGIASKSLGQESISYTQNDLTPSAKLALSKYRIRIFQ